MLKTLNVTSYRLQVIRPWRARYKLHDYMSFDLKKQKANIQKEKRKVAPCSLFCHPVAYKPKPKGKEKAFRDNIKAKRIGAVDITNGSKCAKREFNLKDKDNKLCPDKNAASLFYSKMPPIVSGKRGKNVSDVFFPASSSILKNHLANNFNNQDYLRKDDSFYSYPGYKGTARLRINVNRINPSSFDGLGEKLGDLEKSLPSYSEDDIANIENLAQSENYLSSLKLSEEQEETEDQFLNNLLEEQKEREKITQQEEQVSPAYQDTLDEKSREGTRIKLSFSQPLMKLPAIGVEEEEEEEAIKSPFLKFEREPIEKLSLSENQNIPNQPLYELGAEKYEPEQPAKLINFYNGEEEPKEESFQESISTIDLSNYSNDSFKSRSGIPVSISQKQNDARPFTSDYSPIPDYEIPGTEALEYKPYPYKEKSKWFSFKPFQKNFFSEWLKPKKIQEPKIINLEFLNGRAYSENREEQGKYLKPYKKPWYSYFLTQKEEKIIHKSFDRSFGPIKRNFFSFRTGNARRGAIILVFGIITASVIPAGVYVQKIIEAKDKIEDSSEQAYQEVKSAKSAILSAKPEEARQNFQSAYNNFVEAGNSLNEVEGSVLNIIKVLPGGSKIKTGENVLEAGKHLTAAGQIMSEAFNLFLGDQGALKKKFIATDNLSNLRELTSSNFPSKSDKAESLTGAIILFQEKLVKAKEELLYTSTSLDKVNVSDLPEGKKEEFGKLKDQLPTLIKSIDLFSEYSMNVLKILGHERPKQYLFLFENNDEIRATGGFIGTYGLLKIDQGNISQLFIDGIYNPDGQLKERVIPPRPIQKMSATWSMHDANWWPDFPKSAEKVAWFYEKTGGPPVDGVIAFTPKILEEFLKITGPINHEKYNTIVTAENFVEIAQHKVEVEYDKNLNRPKQFLADLAPLVLEKVFSAPPEKWIEILNVFSKCLDERSIIVYFFDFNQQKVISELGWSGEILETPKDYLSVVNTNISGMKTDKMIEQKIEHSAEIKSDGSIVDTVTITRTHKGGKEKYEWYNAVNSNYLRLYVPKGAELLSAEGYTREVNASPLDYKKLGFVEDEMVLTEESAMKIDPYTGTLIYEDSGKTVFANWTYVSPGETLRIKYTYLLPFKLSFDDIKKPADTYSLLFQKQAGDENSTLGSAVNGLDNFDEIYHYPEDLISSDWNFNKKFDKDTFAGVVLAKKGSEAAKNIEIK